ncbi:ATP-binding protein [Nocardioides plantarum]|uniref:Hpr(Ser) kinase/phosphatase n=1 Tax=Nocardioides plantarum TaxID=29299 RepID=A0ABV5K6F4_9ACTN|nr:ATP-binding protein [Nocardioides plantarum]
MTGDPVDDCICVDLRAMDTRVRVEVRGTLAADLADDLRHAWSRCLVPYAGPADATVDATIRVVIDDDPAVVQRARAAGDLASTARDEVLDRLSPRVTIAAITHQAGRLLMLHACGLADPETGRTVALVAPSGTGKTTASRVLGRDLGYVSDETVAIRPDGSVATYPKPLSVVGDGRFKDQVSLDDLRLRRAPERCHLAGVAILVRDGDRAGRVEHVETVDALARLAPESSSLAAMPRPLHQVAELLDRTGGLRVLHYAEAAQLRPMVTEMLTAS